NQRGCDRSRIVSKSPRGDSRSVQRVAAGAGPVAYDPIINPRAGIHDRFLGRPIPSGVATGHGRESAMPVLSAVALKGGVGKTTLTHMIAGALALARGRVLCLDNDPQGSLSSGMFGPGAVEAMDPARTIAAL